MPAGRPCAAPPTSRHIRVPCRPIRDPSHALVRRAMRRRGNPILPAGRCSHKCRLHPGLPTLCRPLRALLRWGGPSDRKYGPGPDRSRPTEDHPCRGRILEAASRALAAPVQPPPAVSARRQKRTAPLLQSRWCISCVISNAYLFRLKSRLTASRSFCSPIQPVSFIAILPRLSSRTSVGTIMGLLPG